VASAIPEFPLSLVILMAGVVCPPKDPCNLSEP
jgi:hypothetical protein